MNPDIHDALQRFAPISLEEMSAVKLMNRIDAKYVIPVRKLVPLLEDAAGLYYAQCIEGERSARYHTVYLDTADHRMYYAHAVGRQVRQKIRVRTYEDTHDTFLEVKNKNNHGRTKKKRIAVPGVEQLGLEAADFLTAKSWYRLPQLQPHVENHFERITLVNKAKTERLTIDLGIQFHNYENQQNANLNHLVIIELKRDGLTPSPMLELFRKHRILPGGFSKYCIGCCLTNPQLKHNNFKEKLMRIERLKRI